MSRPSNSLFLFTNNWGVGGGLPCSIAYGFNILPDSLRKVLRCYIAQMAVSD